MGQEAYIRILNKSRHDVTVSIEERTRVDDEGMGNLQGVLRKGSQFPADDAGTEIWKGRYQRIEGDPKRRFHKDGHFELVVARIDAANDEEPSSVKLSVDHDDWWASCRHHGHEGHDDGTDVLDVTADVDEEEEEDKFRIEIHIYDAIPTNTWMGHLGDAIAETPLCRLAIPGTHDSATYTFNKDLGAAPDSDLTMTIQEKLEIGSGLIQKIGSAINDRILGMVFERMCKCQDLSIAEQLEAGIRYLDLRVASHEDGKFYSCHGVYCVDMQEIMSQVNGFLTEHPKEIVILDFNHFYAMDAEQHGTFSGMLLERLGSKVATRPDLSPSSSVGGFWERGAQAIVVYHHNDTAMANNKLWSRGAIQSPWPNKNTTDELHAKLGETIQDRPLQKFFVLQGILTPDGELIKEEILENKGKMSLQSIAGRVSKKVLHWVEDEWQDQTHNIVIVDFFDDCCMVPAILNLNEKP